MAAGAWKSYGPYQEALRKKLIDEDVDEFRMMLLDSGHTPDRSAHDQVSDISGDECANYERQVIAGAVSRSGLVVTFTAAADTAIVASGGDIDDPKYAVIYHLATLRPAYICDLNSGGGAHADIPENSVLLVPLPGDGIFEHDYT